MKASETKKTADVKKVTEAAENATTVIEGSEMGEVKIHENVISSLVRQAALSIDGVSRLAGSTLVDSIAEIVGSRRMQSRAITVEMEENNRVAVELKINIKCDFNVPEVAQAVQKAVIEKIEKITGMTVTSAMGCGAQRGGNGMYRGVPVSMSLRPTVEVSVVVSRIPPEVVVETAKQALHTGNLGDGKIFLTPVEDAVKVRTGETGHDALQDEAS